MSDKIFTSLDAYEYSFKKVSKGLELAKKAWLEVLNHKDSFALNISEDDLTYELFDRVFRINLLNLGDFGVVSIETHPIDKRDRSIELVSVRMNIHGQLEKSEKSLVDPQAYGYVFVDMIHDALEAERRLIAKKYEQGYTVIR